jgi:pyrimidine and pyridine-specific 5'-nucleotidase
MPGDIRLQILLLEKYARSTFDVLGHLAPPLAFRILKHLPPKQLLELGRVSRRWYTAVHHPVLWRALVGRITRGDPTPPRAPVEPDSHIQGGGIAGMNQISGWERLYQALHHRESNFARGIPQSVRFLAGHSNYVTTLLLRGSRLISGSYDETVRFWDVGSGREERVLRCGKPVSCVDYLEEEGECRSLRVACIRPEYKDIHPRMEPSR